MVSVLGSALTGVAASCEARVLLAVGVVILGLVVLLYLHWQYDLRRWGADYVAACCWWQARIIGDPNLDLDASHFGPPEAAGEAANQSGFFIARAIRMKAVELSGRGGTARRRLELLSYSLTILLGAAAVIKVLLSCGPHCSCP